MDSLSLDNFSRRQFLCLQDQDQDHKIMYTEFLAATIEAQGFIAEDRIAEAFDRLDVNETGYSTSKQTTFCDCTS